MPQRNWDHQWPTVHRPANTKSCENKKEKSNHVIDSLLEGERHDPATIEYLKMFKISEQVLNFITNYEKLESVTNNQSKLKYKIK